MTKAQVIALIDQYITTNGNEEITGAQTNSVMKALANQDIPFSEIVSTPTTLSGYGITDAYTKSVSDGRYVNVGGDSMTGELRVTPNTTAGATTQAKTIQLGATSDGSFISSGNNAGGAISYVLRGYQSNGIQMTLNEGAISAQGEIAVRAVGTGVGVENLSRVGFFESNGTVEQGYVGFASSARSDLNLRNFIGNTYLQLREEGGVDGLQYIYNGNVSNNVYHTGNLNLSTLGGVPTTRTITAGTGLTGGGNLTANRTINVNFGTSAGTVAQGNDSRINNGQTAFSWGNHASAGYVTLSGGQTITSWKKIVPTNVIADNGAGVMTFGNNGTGAFFSSGTGTGGAYSFILRGYESSGVQLDLNDGGIVANGNVTAIGFYESSDIRLKKNIKPLNYGLNEIEKIDTHTWNWKKDGSEDIGVIAQQLELIMPELVKTNEEGYKSVNYSKLVPVLINAIKELSNGKK